MKSPNYHLKYLNIWGRRLENQWLHKFNPTLTELQGPEYYTGKKSPKIEENGVKFKFWLLSISKIGDPCYFII